MYVQGVPFAVIYTLYFASLYLTLHGLVTAYLSAWTRFSLARLASALLILHWPERVLVQGSRRPERCALIRFIACLMRVRPCTR